MKTVTRVTPARTVMTPVASRASKKAACRPVISARTTSATVAGQDFTAPSATRHRAMHV